MSTLQTVRVNRKVKSTYCVPSAVPCCYVIYARRLRHGPFLKEKAIFLVCQIQTNESDRGRVSNNKYQCFSTFNVLRNIKPGDFAKMQIQ